MGLLVKRESVATGLGVSRHPRRSLPEFDSEVALRRGVNSVFFRWIRAAGAGRLGHRPASLLCASAATGSACWTRR